MENEDTILLLKECDSGSKMAVSAIQEILEKTTEPKLKELFTESTRHHADLGNRLHSLLLKNHSEEKDPAAMAKGMAWLKTNVMLTMKNNDRTIADLITDGCNMGIKTLNKYLNQYANADGEAKALCRDLIKIEEDLRRDLRAYL